MRAPSMAMAHFDAAAAATAHAAKPTEDSLHKGCSANELSSEGTPLAALEQSTEQALCGAIRQASTTSAPLPSASPEPQSAAATTAASVATLSAVQPSHAEAGTLVPCDGAAEPAAKAVVAEKAQESADGKKAAVHREDLLAGMRAARSSGGSGASGAGARCHSIDERLAYALQQQELQRSAGVAARPTGVSVFVGSAPGCTTCAMSDCVKLTMYRKPRNDCSLLQLHV